MRRAQPQRSHRPGCRCAVYLCLQHSSLAHLLQQRAILQAMQLGVVAGCEHQEMLNSCTPDGINTATFISTLRWAKVKRASLPLSVIVEAPSLEEACFRLAQKLDLMVRAEAGGAAA